MTTPLNLYHIYVSNLHIFLRRSARHPKLEIINKVITEKINRKEKIVDDVHCVLEHKFITAWARITDRRPHITK